VAQLYTFKNYTHKEGLDYSNISGLTQTNDGLIYLGTNNSGLVKFEGKNFKELYFKNKDNNH